MAYGICVSVWPGLFDRDPERMPLARLIAVVGAQFGRYSQRVLAEHGATATSVGLLGALAEEDGLSHREMARRLWLTPATLTPVVGAPEATRHIRRSRDRTCRCGCACWRPPGPSCCSAGWASGDSSAAL